MERRVEKELELNKLIHLNADRGVLLDFRLKTKI